MFDPGYDPTIVQRGIDEALACRDMLAPVSPTPTRLARLAATFSALLRLLRPARDEMPVIRPSVARLWR